MPSVDGLHHSLSMIRKKNVTRSDSLPEKEITE